MFGALDTSTGNLLNENTTKAALTPFGIEANLTVDRAQIVIVRDPRRR